MIRAAIKGTSSFLPENELTNGQLAAEFPEYTPDKIFDKTGIRVRHIASPDECASDLGIAAAQRLFDSGVCLPREVDFLLFCTQSPDYFLPTTACLVQNRLGLATSCGAIDINQGCSGFVYGLALANSLIETETVKNVLLITADTYTKFINRRDKSVRTLFGDGAAATLVTAVESERPIIGPFVFGTDGTGAADLIVPAGGSRRPLDAEAKLAVEDDQGNWRSSSDLYMNGGAIFNFTLRTVPRLIEELLDKSGLGLDDIDYFIPHQANKFMLDRLRLRMKLPVEKFFCDMELTANTVSSTIPIAFETARKKGMIKVGDKVAFIGFGVGLSWAGTLVEVT